MSETPATNQEATQDKIRQDNRDAFKKKFALAHPETTPPVTEANPLIEPVETKKKPSFYQTHKKAISLSLIIGTVLGANYLKNLYDQNIAKNFQQQLDNKPISAPIPKENISMTPDKPDYTKAITDADKQLQDSKQITTPTPVVETVTPPAPVETIAASTTAYESVKMANYQYLEIPQGETWVLNAKEFRYGDLDLKDTSVIFTTGNISVYAGTNEATLEKYKSDWKTLLDLKEKANPALKSIGINPNDMAGYLFDHRAGVPAPIAKK